MKRLGTLRQVWQIILDLVYPRLCVCCQQPGTWLCQNCVDTIEHFPLPRCIRCDLPVSKHSAMILCEECERQPMPYLDGLRTVGPHKGALRQAIHAFKYEKNPELALPLGSLLAEGWQKRGGFEIDGLLPIPLHPDRERERGFNQSERLAQVMSQHLMIPIRTDILTRIRNTISQVGLSGSQRQQNMSGAFVASPEAAGKRWLLVDDVCTTGTTLITCAHTLRQQGAQSVWAISITRPFYDYETERWQDDLPPEEITKQQAAIWEWSSDL